MGLQLKSPLVVGASAPLSENLDNIKRIQDAEGAAIVLHSFFQEQLQKEKLDLANNLNKTTDVFHVGEEEYLNHIRKAKEVTGIPIIASINVSDLGDWAYYSKKMEQAGADAIELNIYNVPTNFEQSSAQLEQNYIDIVKTIKANVSIPIALKISPFFSNMAYIAKQFADHGADALVLFNRFYQPDIDLEKLAVSPNLLLSTSQDMRLPLRWIAILYGRIDSDFAATSGIKKAEDVIKMIMVGANVTMIVGALLRYGISYLVDLRSEIVEWMEKHDYQSIKEIQGSISQINCSGDSAFERVQYIKALQTYHPIWSKNI